MHNTENHILNQQGQPALVASFFVIESVIRFIDMFSGIGGFREGLTRAGGFACVGHCEIDKYANRSYNALFDTKGEWFIEDARKADPSTMPDFQLTLRRISLPNVSALQEPEEDSEIRAALSSLNWPDWLKPGSLRICCLKMYPACYLMTEGGHLRRSSTRWTDWGMVWNGNVLTAKISAFPSQETACTLSDILMSDVEEKYFLSPKQQEVLLFKPTAATKESASTPPKD